MGDRYTYEYPDGTTGVLLPSNRADLIANMKRDDTISGITIDFSSTQPLRAFIDDVADLLKSNCKIKRVDARFFFDDRRNELFFQALSTGQVGDNLESLTVTMIPGNVLRDDVEIGLLESYLRRNQNLTHFDIPLHPGPAALRLISTLGSGSKVTRLGLSVSPDRWAGELRELGSRIGKCSSLASLELSVLSNISEAQSGFFWEGIAKMRRLSQLEICMLNRPRGAHSPLVIDDIGQLVAQRGRSLEHFAFYCNDTTLHCKEIFGALGSSLCSVKSVCLLIDTRESLHMMLPRLQSCESLELRGNFRRTSFGSTGSIVSCLPKLKTITISRGGFTDVEGIKEDLLEMVKSSNSITKVVLIPDWWEAQLGIRGELECFCLLNKVFKTNLICFDPTDLWARVLSKIPGEQARATLLYHLLREKPELIVGRNGKSSKCQRLGFDNDVDAGLPRVRLCTLPAEGIELRSHHATGV